MIQDLFMNAEKVGALTVALTELAKKVGVPTKYLPYVATFMGMFTGLVLSLPQESLTSIEGLLSGRVLGAITTLLYGASQGVFTSGK